MATKENDLKLKGHLMLLKQQPNDKTKDRPKLLHWMKKRFVARPRFE
jgi:hypothetical protein